MMFMSVQLVTRCNLDPRQFPLTVFFLLCVLYLRLFGIRLGLIPTVAYD